jgi:hypothetical protein
VAVKLEPVLTLAVTDSPEALGIVSNETVFDAVMSSIYLPETVPLKSRFAVITIDLAPSELCATVTVCLASSVSVNELELLLITLPLNFNWFPLIVI